MCGSLMPRRFRFGPLRIMMRMFSAFAKERRSVQPPNHFAGTELARQQRTEAGGCPQQSHPHGGFSPWFAIIWRRCEPLCRMIKYNSTYEIDFIIHNVLCTRNEGA